MQFPAQANGSFIKVMDLRYGENPHQSGAFYRDLGPVPGTLATFQQLQGKELSFNNLADADAAWECVRQFDAPACVIVKHANPCGVALGAACADAYEQAYATDPTSAFGGIIAFNRALDADTAKAILDRQFVEVLIAPDYAAGALEYARKKANVRVLRIALAPPSAGFIDTKRIGSGLLLQASDNRGMSRAELKVVSKLAPTEAQFADLLFAWKVAKFVKSNAIVYARGLATVGIGAGQMSRVVAARIAALKAAEAGLAVAGCVMASDAFFPFRDGIDAAAAAGIRAVIQPGGSMRDAEVIAAADEHDMAMPCSSAAAMTSASRIEPPGWITALIPAAAAASMPSRNGKNASEAITEPDTTRCASAALIPAMRAEYTRLICPAPTPMVRLSFA